MADMKEIRIAILECDTPTPQTQAKYGGYGGVFKTLLDTGAESIGFPSEKLKLSYFDVVGEQAYPNLDQVDAVLLSGSKHNSFDNDEWILKLVDFTKKVLSQERVRLIGVCFGHQILGRALGIQTGRYISWEVSTCPVNLTAKGMELFGRDTLIIHQMHRDIVFSYPPGVEALGSSPSCEVQGMYKPGRFISVQGHPEFNEGIMHDILQTRHDQGVFDDALFEDAKRRAGNSHDGVAVAGAFLRFLQE